MRRWLCLSCLLLSSAASGANPDDVSGNHRASDTTTVTRGAFNYVFTDIACKPNVAFGAAGQCAMLTADQRLPAAYSQHAYLTTLSGGVPVPRSTSAATTVALHFAMRCVLPLKHANVKATINGAALPLCADGPNPPPANSSAWSGAIALVFAANVPSSKIAFYYADVGRVRLSVKELAGTPSTSPSVVFRPVSLRMRVSGNPSTVSSNSAPFMAAGASFPVRVDALMANNVAAPNFGNGDATISIARARPSSSGTSDEKAMAAAMGSLPALLTTGLDTAAGGVFSGSASFGEVGVLVLTASIDGGYLGVHDVTEAVQKVGRFYPAAFKTTVTPVFADCAAIPLSCPAGAGAAAYATQPFDVAVTPLDVHHGEVKNFRGVFGDPIALAAFDSAGGASANPPGAGSLTAATIPALGVGDSNASLHTAVSYALPLPFSRTAPVSRAWSVPTAIFLRASAVDTPNLLTVTSLQSGMSLEGGIMILNGRLLLSTVSGSELLRLPVTMAAQFWNKAGTAPGAWTTNLADNSATHSTIAFSTCKRNLLVAKACFSGLQMASRDPVFTAGKARFFIAAPGAGNSGSVMVTMGGAPVWLPSTLTQAVFGYYKSYFIYLREVF